MPDYQQSKVYEIVCNITGDKYIGATVQTLARRLAVHVNESKNNKKKCMCCVIIKRGDYYINLLESYPCKNKDELRMCERKWYDLIPNINKRSPLTTIEERKEYQKDYQQNEKCKDYHKQYYLKKKLEKENLNIIP